MMEANVASMAAQQQQQQLQSDIKSESNDSQH